MRHKGPTGCDETCWKRYEGFKMGLGAFIKAGFPADEGSDITLEGGVDIFPSDNGDGSADRTAM